MSALEASCAGIPMILSNVGGCPELIDKNGILTNNTEDDIRTALDIIINDYDTFLKQAQENKQKFDINKMALKYKELILNDIR